MIIFGTPFLFFDIVSKKFAYLRGFFSKLNFRHRYPHLGMYSYILYQGRTPYFIFFIKKIRKSEKFPNFQFLLTWNPHIVAVGILINIQNQSFFNFSRFQQKKCNFRSIFWEIWIREKVSYGAKKCPAECESD